MISFIINSSWCFSLIAVATMCFSATASFVASGALIGGGIAAISHYKFSRKEMPLAAIPLIFGLHQLSEGLIWLGLGGLVSELVQNAAMHFYVFIAMSFWPAYIAYAILVYEWPKRRTPLLLLFASGFLLGGYLLWSYTVYSELSLNLNCCKSLSYLFKIPWGHNYLDGFYVFLVVLPFLLSSNPRIRYVLGPGFLATFVLALVIQSGGDYPSIWCFLAAILSIVNYYALRHRDSKSVNTLDGR